MKNKKKRKSQKPCKCDIPLIWTALATVCLRCNGKI